MTLALDPLAHMLADWEPSPPSPYLTDPIAWAHDKLGAPLWSKQRAIAESVVVNRRTAVKSCHGAGKSWTAGMLAAWWIDIHPPGDAIVISTAPTYKQVHAVLWEEIRSAHRKGKLPGVVLQTDEWKIGDVLVGMGRKPADHHRRVFRHVIEGGEVLLRHEQHVHRRLRRDVAERDQVLVLEHDVGGDLAADDLVEDGV